MTKPSPTTDSILVPGPYRLPDQSSPVLSPNRNIALTNSGFGQTVSVSLTVLPRAFFAAALVFRMDTSEGITLAGLADIVDQALLDQALLDHA